MEEEIEGGSELERLTGKGMASLLSICFRFCDTFGDTLGDLLVTLLALLLPVTLPTALFPSPMFLSWLPSLFLSVDFSVCLALFLSFCSPTMSFSSLSTVSVFP